MRKTWVILSLLLLVGVVQASSTGSQVTELRYDDSKRVLHMEFKSLESSFIQDFIKVRVPPSLKGHSFRVISSDVSDDRVASRYGIDNSRMIYLYPTTDGGIGGDDFPDNFSMNLKFDEYPFASQERNVSIDTFFSVLLRDNGAWSQTEYLQVELNENGRESNNLYLIKKDFTGEFHRGSPGEEDKIKIELPNQLIPRRDKVIVLSPFTGRLDLKDKDVDGREEVYIHSKLGELPVNHTLRIAVKTETERNPGDAEVVAWDDDTVVFNGTVSMNRRDFENTGFSFDLLIERIKAGLSDEGANNGESEIPVLSGILEFFNSIA